MKRIKIIFLLLLNFFLFSCNKEEFVDEGYLKIDYKVDLKFFDDLAVCNDNNVYVLSNIGGNPEMTALQRINPTGRVSELKKWSAYYSAFPFLAFDSQGKLYMSNDDLQGKIYSFSNDYTQSSSYTMQGADQLHIRMNGFCSLPDDSFIVLDNYTVQVKRYYPNLNSDVIVAGSGNYGTTDGTGLNASFKWFFKAKSFNYSVYTIDEKRIRKIDCSTTNYNVTTPFTTYGDDISEIAIDSNETIYALMNQKIYKITNGNAILYKSGIENVRSLNDNSLSTIDWSNISRIYIKNNDLYLVSGYGTLMKISNFQTKLK